MIKNSIYIDYDFFRLEKEFVLNEFQNKLNNVWFDYEMTIPEYLQEYKENEFWVHPIGRLNMTINIVDIGDDAIEKLKNSIHQFCKLMEPMLQVTYKVNEQMALHKEGIRPFTDISFFIELETGEIICFLLHDLLSDNELVKQVNLLLVVLKKIVENDESLINQIKQSFKVDEQTVFFWYNRDTNLWDITDILFQLGKEKMVAISKNSDKRFAKPDMMVNAKNLRQEFTFPSNWTIKSKKRGYVMNQPNDIAMYSSIADKAVERAREKYDQIHSKTVSKLIISDDDNIPIFDFFEEIIQAVIMSYTTIESMSNTCIPWRFEYSIGTPEKRITFNKDGIEKHYNLKDKLKLIIPAALGLDSPIKASWWQKLVALEKLRNEIIHSKSSSAEVRYSMFIDEEIFDLVKCHHEVVAYYGKELLKIKSSIINDFPIGVGCDEIIPKLITQKSYNSIFNDLHNPSNPLPE